LTWKNSINNTFIYEHHTIYKHSCMHAKTQSYMLLY
jgi:hypothetical protein